MEGGAHTILKGNHPGTISARFGLIWFSQGEDLNAIFYQNIPNLHNRYISAERKMLRSWPTKIPNMNKMRQKTNVYLRTQDVRTDCMVKQT